MNEESSSRTPIIVLIGTIGLLLVLGGLYLVNRVIPAPPKPVEQVLPMGAPEQAYATQIHFLDTKVGRATNFLNQDVTFAFGTVQNSGTRNVKQIEITLEFHDPFNQVVLRDKELLLSPTAPPLAPNEQRDFQLSYETMPAEWNQAFPAVHVTGLVLQ